MIDKLYAYRFEIFFFSQISILFGSLIFPIVLFDEILSPILFQINLLAGILLLYKKKKFMWFLIVLLVFAGISFGLSIVKSDSAKFFNVSRMAVLFLFYVIVTTEIILQIWRSELIGQKEILGLISGYISLGLISFFICLSIEVAHPESFKVMESAVSNSQSLQSILMYYGYITMLTIGYGDVIPITDLARKAAVLIGLMGQIYLVVITAIVVGKFINQLKTTKKSQ